MKSLTDIQREWEEIVRVASKAVTADVNNIVYLVVKPEALTGESNEELNRCIKERKKLGR